MSRIVAILSAATLLLVPLQAGTHPSPPTSWQVEMRYHTNGRLDFLTAYLGASDVSRAPDAGVEIALLISCEEASLGIFISAGTALMGDWSKVAFAFDAEATETAIWPVDPRDGVSVMLREAGAVRGFLERVLLADELTVTIGEADRTKLVLNLRMSDADRQKVSSGCGLAKAVSGSGQ